MTDLSNPTSRVLDIVHFLAAHPKEEFSLADISRTLAMSKASARRVLGTLAEAGLLARNDRRKTFSLGMGALALGQAAREKYPGLDAARSEMAALAAELGVQCSVSALIGSDLVILARDGAPQSHEGLNRVGERRPMMPPMGICHVAWGSPELVDPWLATAEKHMTAGGYAWLCEALPLIRRRGYAMASNKAAWPRLRAATVAPPGLLREGAHWAGICAMLGELSRNEIQLADPADLDGERIGQISVPVFSSEGVVAFQLVLSGLPDMPGTDRVQLYVERLLAAGASVTSRINGVVPVIR